VSCEDVWRSLEPLATAGSVRAPSRDRFLRACAMLPKDARPCLDPARHLATPDACRKALDAVPTATRKSVDDLLKSPVP